MKKLFAAAVATSMLAFASTASAATVVVHPFSMDGWITQQSGTATVGFVAGPGTPPAGDGSVELRVGSDGNSAAQVRNGDYAGTLLSDLTTLTYNTYVQQDGLGGQAPYILLNVDLDGNGTTDDLLFFEPVYQNSVFFTNDQGPLLVGVWQDWNALDGGWWSVNGTAGATPGTGVKSLEDYIAAEPDAAVASGPALRVVTGFGAGAWDNFVGNADAVTVGVNGSDTTYDFEPDSGPPTSKDQCKKDGWKQFDSPPFKNQGQCVSFVNHS
jgi:hypothetical protein